ncbi:MAG: hypothetical protein JXN10_01270 [Clostridia bacterium]|nr:hypothetical protein [Clostridia bacterium]MBN2882131.1 hypothetical protein [Clostridia bacterium]
MITFKDIPGRASLKKRLGDEVKTGHAGHAYILEGPSGCGKKDIARAFAYKILCMSEKSEKPCGKCRHCTIVNAGGTGELYELFPDKGSISINSIRELQQNINLIPVSANRKVYLVIDADNMTIAAQNCILKTLEEPPEYATIILTVSNSDKLIETIQSRAVLIQVGINSIEEIEEYLGKNTKFETRDIQMAARCADGSVGKALGIIGSKDFSEQRIAAIDFAECLISKEFKKALSATGALSKGNSEIFFTSLSAVLRDMLIMKTTEDYGYLINQDKKDIIIRGSDRYPEHILSKMISIVNEASDRLAANAAKKQTMDAMIVKITEELAGW